MLGPLPFARDSQCDPALASPQWYSPKGGPCIYFSRMATLRAQSELRNMLDSLEASGLITVINVDSVFCPDETCSFFGENDLILYRDQYSHPSVEAALSAASHISQVLQANFESR